MLTLETASPHLRSRGNLRSWEKGLAPYKKQINQPQRPFILHTHLFLEKERKKARNRIRLRGNEFHLFVLSFHSTAMPFIHSAIQPFSHSTIQPFIHHQSILPSFHPSAEPSRSVSRASDKHAPTQLLGELIRRNAHKLPTEGKWASSPTMLIRSSSIPKPYRSLPAQPR